MKAKTHRKAACLVSVFLIGLPCLAAQQARPLHERSDLVLSERLADSLPATQETWSDGTVTFLSDDQLALSLCHIYGDSQCPVLIILQIADAGFHPLAVRNHPGPFASLRPTAGGGVLTHPSQPWLEFQSELFSAELISKLQIPSTAKVSLSGKTLAREGPSHSWTISLICPSLDCLQDVAQVTGELKAISDDEIAILDGKMIRIETIQGKRMGGFKVQPDCGREVEFAGTDRIYLRSCGHDQIVDLNGKELARLLHAGDWGTDFRGWSTDGTRLLYDQHTRTVSGLQKFWEPLFMILSLWTNRSIGSDQEVTGETVRVLDTTTGKACFYWSDAKHLANGGVYPHAALSPSGKSVALVTEGELRIYRLPDTCSGAKSK